MTNEINAKLSQKNGGITKVNAAKNNAQPGILVDEHRETTDGNFRVNIMNNLNISCFSRDTCMGMSLSQIVEANMPTSYAKKPHVTKNTGNNE